MGAIDDYLQRNRDYTDSYDRADLPAPPCDKAAIVTCMDARIDLHGLLGLRDGSAHVIRNAGGVVTEDVIRSLTLSQRLLGTCEIMLIHHTCCGLLADSDDEIRAAIERDTGIRPPFGLETFPDLDEDVRRSIARIRSSPFVPHKDTIRGFVYEVETGKLREVTASAS